MKKLLTITGIITTFFTAGQVSTAGLNYDGSNDQSTAPHHTALDLAAGEFTMEAWIKGSPSTLASYPAICAKRDPGDAFTGFVFAIKNSNGTLWMQVEGTNYFSDSGPNLLDGQCHHVAISRINTGLAADSLIIYIDGAVVGYDQITATKNISSPGLLAIGGDLVSPNNHRYEGDIKELRIWNTAIPAASILANMNTQIDGSSPNLVAYYTLDENSGQDIYDYTINANDGILGISNSVEPEDPSWISTCPISLGLGVEDLVEAPIQLMKIVDLLGRETENKPNTVLIYQFSNGTTKKVFWAE